jgi:hypothetical protein
MKRKTTTTPHASNNMSIEEKLRLMDELYWRAAQDGSLERYRREREKGVEEVRRRWQRLREHFLKHPSYVSR